MSSRREQRERLRRERLAREEAERTAAQRRRRLWQLGAGASVAAVAVALAVLISQAGSGRQAPVNEALRGDAQAVQGLFAGIPQEGISLGDPRAPVTLVEFADLQCPFCARYAREVLPAVLDRHVRTGPVRLELRTLAFLGPDSRRGADLAAAAAEQDRMWPFVELFLRRQGAENTGYATDAFLSRLARATPGLDPDRALESRGSPETRELLAEAERAASRLGVESTPSFFVVRRGAPPRQLETTALTPDAFAAALEEALEGG